MGKDPAFLFYYQDFLVGVSFMNLEERGAYITLLCFQAAHGSMSEKDILKKIPAPIWEAICCKFICKDGSFFNERLALEITKRQNYTISRRKNLHMNNHMARHMEAHMENENENINEDVNINKDDRGVQGGFGELWDRYPLKVGRKAAERHFLATVKTDRDLIDIKTALNNYLKSERVLKGYIQNGSTWFNNWCDWVNFVEQPKPNLSPAQQYSVSTMAKLNERLKNEKR